MARSAATRYPWEMAKISEDDMIYDDGRWVICKLRGTVTGRRPRKTRAGVTKTGPECNIMHRHRVIQRGPDRKWEEINYWPCDWMILKGKKNNWVLTAWMCTSCQEAVPEEVLQAREFIEVLG